MNKNKMTLYRVGICILAVFLMTACSNVANPPALVPPPPKQTESVLPHMAKVTAGIDDVTKQNVRLSEQLQSQQKTMAQQKIAISEALAQAEKMKTASKTGTVMETDANDLVMELKQVQSRNLFLETSNTELVALKTEQEKTLFELKAKSADTVGKLSEMENENSTLRSQNKYLGTSLNDQNKELKSLSSDLSKEKVKSAKNGVYKFWVIGLISAFVFWTILKNVLMVYMPATRFRI